MDAFETVIPSMFADITVSAVERLCLLLTSYDLELFNVLMEFADYLTLSSNFAGIAKCTHRP